jgi:molybdate transport system permease protein
MVEPEDSVKGQVSTKKAATVIPLGRWAQKAWRLSVLPLLAFFLIPIVVIFIQTTPARIVASLSDPQVYKGLAVSLKTTLISLGLILALGTPVAFLMGRVKFHLKSLVETLIDLPTVLPPSVAGLALLLTFGRNGAIGSLLSRGGISVAFTQAAVVMAQMFIAAPYYIRSAAIGFSSIDQEYIEAAQLDGADPWQLFRFIILPIARYSLLSGTVLSWARALGEFGATIMFAGNFMGRTQTMPLAIYLGFESNLEAALTLSVILIGISCCSLILVRVITGKMTSKLD